MKKILFTLVGTLLFSTWLTAAVQTGDCGDQGNNLTYSFDDVDGTLTISGTGEMGNYSYTSIAPWRGLSFSSAVINEGVTSIGELAFDGCSTLKSVSLPNSLKTIAGTAFSWCSSLESIVIPEGVETIGNVAFKSCSALKSVSLPTSLKTIGGSAFSDCPLESIVIPEGVETIGMSAFTECTALKSVSLPASLKTIEEYAFGECTSLQKIVIPGGVTSIGENLFSKATKLTDVYCLASDLTKITIGANDFKGNTIHVPAASVDAYKSAEIWKTAKNIVAIKEYNVKILSSKEEWGTVTGGGVYGDYESVTIEATAQGGSTFLGWSDGVKENPRTLSLKGDTTITAEFAITGDCGDKGDNVKWKLTSDGTITFTGSGNMMGYLSPNPWEGYSSQIKKVVVEEGVTSIASDAFSNMSTVSEIDIASTVTYIGGGAFYGTKWENDQQGIVYIGNILYLYKGGEAVIKDGTTLICNAVFYELDATSIIIPESVNRIEGRAFESSKLESIIIPNNVTTIECTTFSNCRNLKTVFLGEKLSKIEDFAFEYCYGLKDIYCNAEQVPTLSFSGIDGSPVIHVKKELVEAYKAAPNWGKFTIVPIYEYNMTLTPNKDAWGTVVGSGVYNEALTITIEAIPQVGSTFIEWSDGVTDNPRQIVITQDTALTAEFKLNKYFLFLNCEREGGGVSGAGIYDYGTTATIEAVSKEGYELVQWSDGNTENPREVVVTQDSILTAEFALKVYTLTASCDAAQGSVTGAGEYEHGSTATIEALANEGYKFVKWSDEDTANPREIKVTGDVTLTAIFEVDKSTAVENGKISSANIYVNNGILHIENASEGYQVFDMSGRIVYDGKSEAISLPNGIYVIRIGKEVSKITL